MPPAACLLLTATCLLPTADCLAQRLEMRAEPAQVTEEEMVALQVYLHDVQTRTFSSPVVSTPNFTVEALSPEQGRWLGNGILWRYLLVPNRAGTFRVGVSVTLNEKLLRGEAVVRVIEKRLTVPSHGTAEIEDLTGRRFVRAVADRTSAYLHQRILYRFRYFYENLPPTGEAPQYALPAFNGFFSRQLGSGIPVHEGKEVVNGRSYYVEEIRVALFPLTAGKHRIPPTRLVLPESVGGKRQELQTEPVEVTILPLPEPSPADFSGGVGDFRVSTEMVEDAGRVGEPVRLHLRIEGQGNLQTATNIPKPEVEGAQVYEPSVKDEMSEEGGGVRTIEYVLVPEHDGTLEVRVPGFSLFSTATGRYERIEPVTLSVQVGKGGEASDRNEARPRNLLRSLFQSPYFWLLFILGAFFLVWRWLPSLERFFRAPARPKAPETGLPSPGRPRSEAPTALDRLRVGDGRRLARELGAILRKYAVERFRLSVDTMAYASVVSALRALGATDAEHLACLLTLCEEGEFAPVTLSTEEQERILREAREIIGRRSGGS